MARLILLARAGRCGAGLPGACPTPPSARQALTRRRRRRILRALPRSSRFPRSTAQLEHALLLYFSKAYEDAWTELGCVLQAAKEAAAARAAVQAFDPEEIEHMEVLLEKIRLQLVFAE